MNAIGCILLDKHRSTDSVLFVLQFFVEVCIDLFIFLLIRVLRWRDTNVTLKCSFDGLKGTKKSMNKIMLFAYPRTHMIFFELMWSMHSVTMVLFIVPSSMVLLRVLLFLI
mmetsp:Transcript_5087/g.7613  ORF Transcript_5087/g.7613 Transcript_5087/m.7613 type:complete len:111 (+) Transcript_5087:288-620(+)